MQAGSRRRWHTAALRKALRRVVVVLWVSALALGGAPAFGSVPILDDGVSGGDPLRVPLIEAPVGCVQPDLPAVVFVGTVLERDYRTARLRIVGIRAGDERPFSTEGIIDVRFGLDVQYLEVGEDYLVSAQRDPLIGVLFSRLREPAPTFGGEQVIAVEDSDLNCPAFPDPIRTLHPNGAPIATSVLAPLSSDRSGLIGALLIPVGVGLGVIFVVAMLRLGIAGVVRGVRRTGGHRVR